MKICVSKIAIISSERVFDHNWLSEKVIVISSPALPPFFFLGGCWPWGLVVQSHLTLQPVELVWLIGYYMGIGNDLKFLVEPVTGFKL